jgi:hypothetical protein
MSDEYTNPYDEAAEVSTDDLVRELFSHPPKPPRSLGILPYSADAEDDIASFNFELLITVYMEAIMDIQRLITILATKKTIEPSNEEKKIDVFAITPELLEIPKVWFNSFGFSYVVTEQECVLKVTDYVPDYYCKIILRDNPHDTEYFNFKRINKPYTFLLHTDYIPTNKLEEIKAVFSKPKIPKDKNSKEMLYTIYFFPLTS